MKSSRRAERGGSSRDIGSVQPLAPTSRRASQQHREASALASAGLSPHPYAAAPSPVPYRSTSAMGGYGRQSPIAINTLPNGNGIQHNSSDTYLFGQTGVKTGTNSRDTTTAGTAPKDIHGVRAMRIYDQEQMQRVGEQDEDGGHGRPHGIWAALCCRA
jgi:casein kinase 1